MRASCNPTVRISACNLPVMKNLSTARCILKGAWLPIRNFSGGQAPHVPDDPSYLRRDRKMFTVNRIWRLMIVLLALAAVASGSIFSHHKHKNKKDKSALPEGVPVLWRAPKDIRQRDLYWGPGGEAARPDLSHVTLIEKEKGGYSTKYRVRDGSGREWVVKLGKEAKGETAASRLMWATGYHTDVNYLVPKVYVEGLNKTLENVRFGLRPKEVKRIDGWQWDHNPFVGSRQVQGLKIMMALLNNWDVKASNNKIAVARDQKLADKESA